jgi:hypothetical protein
MNKCASNPVCADEYHAGMGMSGSTPITNDTQAILQRAFRLSFEIAESEHITAAPIAPCTKKCGYKFISASLRRLLVGSDVRQTELCQAANDL